MTEDTKNNQQDSESGLFPIRTVAAITGDASGTAEILMGLPIVLTEMAYSRKFEREADQYALDSLKSWRICPKHFSNLMHRLMKKRQEEVKRNIPSANEDKENKILNYLSTHPSTERRIEMFDDATDPYNCR